jgi:hypothetical protein
VQNVTLLLETSADVNVQDYCGQVDLCDFSLSYASLIFVRPLSGKASAFRFLPSKVSEMEARLQHLNNIPSRAVLQSLTDKFSASPECVGRVAIQPCQGAAFVFSFPLFLDLVPHAFCHTSSCKVGIFFQQIRTLCFLVSSILSICVQTFMPIPTFPCFFQEEIPCSACSPRWLEWRRHLLLEWWSVPCLPSEKEITFGFPQL